MDLIFTSDFSLEQSYDKIKYITKLENTIIKYNEALRKGTLYVDDATYTNCMELLTMLKPDSPLLKNTKSVKLIKSLDDEIIEYLSEKVKDNDVLEFYLNPQGLNVRLTYENGYLTAAETFGRSFKEDVLDIVKFILTDRNDNLSDFGLINIEGTFVLCEENLDFASELCRVDNPYQGVFSIFDYAQKYKKEIENDKDYEDGEDYSEELRLRDFDQEINFEEYIYFMATDVDLNEFPFEDIKSKYEFLEESGFIVPELGSLEKSDNLSMDIEDIQMMSESMKMQYAYLTDGFRLLLLDEDSILIFKLGSWEITSFEGVVESIEWIDSKCKKLPVLKLKEPIVLLSNNIDNDFLTISEIILNNINLLLILDIKIGDTVSFAYFGEIGILPITKNNEIILN